jgi:hypothetical protein
MARVRPDGKKRELSKDVSAFANSAGGTLIYGIVEDQETHVASDLDDGFDPTEISKEWLEQVINSNIQPRLSGVMIRAVDLITHRPGNVAYVVTVPKSSTAHQAADKRYYKRFNFESVPMEDYEVRDVMQRTSAPSVSIELEIDGETEGECLFKNSGSREKLRLSSPELRIVAVNEPQAATCEYSQHQVFLETDLEVSASITSQDKSAGGYRRGRFLPSATVIENSKESLTFGYYQVDIAPTDMPIFPNERRELCVLQIHIPEPAVLRKQHFVLWRSRASNSEVQAGAICFTLQEGLNYAFSPVSFEWLAERGSLVTLAS